MNKKPCKCCQKDGKIPDLPNGLTYNHLDGEARAWATSNRFNRSEHCVRVKDGKKFSGPDWQKQKCGDGTFGFSTRPANLDDIHMTVGLDGQYKKKKHTLVSGKSKRATASRHARRVDGSRVTLASSNEIMLAHRDPMEMAERRAADKKARRRANRNNKARRGLKKSRKMAA